MVAGSTFVGRDAELVKLSNLLDANSVVTITGPGGIGKTRLARELADRANTDFAGGVLGAELATVGPDRDIADAIARQLGHASIDAVRVSAIDRPTLVIIDDCERTLDQVRQVVTDLVADDADVVVLATSRVPLDLAEERRFPLEPLQIADRTAPGEGPNADAVQLFLDRADAVGASWPRSTENLGAVDAIVGRLDGMPLAIELAAARTRITAPGELAPLLDRQLDLLRRPAERAAERHGSIRSVIHASYDPLSTEQKTLFRHLSHIPPPFDLDLAHQVAGADDDPIATLELLTDLSDRSLLTTSHGENGRTHYRLLEPIRAYGREQLDVMGETGGVEERYVIAVTAFADEVVAEALKHFSATVIDRIADRYAHLLQAIDSCIDHDDSPERAYRLFLPFYAPTSAPRTEVARLGSRVLSRWPDASAPLEAEALAVMAHTSMFAGHDDDALERATASLDHPEATALARTIAERVLGYLAGRAGDRAAGLSHLEAAMAEAQPLGGAFARELRMSWATMVEDPNRRAEAVQILESATEEAAELGETVTLVWAAVAGAHLHVQAGDLEAAARSAERATELSTQMLAPWATAAAQRVAAGVLTITDGWGPAAPGWGAALEVVVAVGDIGGIALTLRNAAAAAEFAGRHDLAGRLWSVVPPHQGASTLTPLFAEQEEQLRSRLGAPVPMILTDSIRQSRTLLAESTIDAEGAASEASANEPSPPREGSTLCFDGFEIDLDAHELRHNGDRVHTEPQVFDVLAYLARNAGRMVSRDELLDEVWGDRFVSPSALSSRIKSARAATGDDGRAQRVIRTIHGRGFMFVAELRQG